MPIKRIEKARTSLPPNYQYGDAAKSEFDRITERYANPVLAMMPDDWARHDATSKYCVHGRPAETCIVPNWLTAEVREKLACR